MKPEVKKKKLNPHTHKKKIFGPHWSEESGVQHKGWNRMQSENGMFSENGNGIRKKKTKRKEEEENNELLFKPIHCM